jgi:hypothetical protein
MKDITILGRLRRLSGQLGKFFLYVGKSRVQHQPYLGDERPEPIGEGPLVPYRTLMEFHSDKAYWEGKVHDECLYEMNYEVLEFHELSSAYKVGIVGGDVYDKATDTRLVSLSEFFKRWLQLRAAQAA